MPGRKPGRKTGTGRQRARRRSAPASWLPGPVRARRPSSDVWRPEPPLPRGLERELKSAREGPRELAYIVVDELLEPFVGLSVTRWPSVDRRGRLRFAGEAVAVGTLLEPFQRFLNQLRRGTEATRELRLGDVFAARVAFPALDSFERRVRELEPDEAARYLDPGTWGEWLTGPLFDVTAGARQATKIAYYAAVAPTLSEKEQAEIGDEEAPLV